MNIATTLDIESANEIAFERTKLSTFNNALLQYYPIASHFSVEIHCNEQILKNNVDFGNQAIKVVLRAESEVLCNQIQSNAYYPRGQKCIPNTTMPLTFQSSLSSIHACQPNTFGGHTPKTEHLSFPSSFWSPRCNACVMSRNEIDRWGFDDYTRADQHPSPGVDTIGTGFTLSKQNRVTRYEFGQHNDELIDTLNWQLDANYCERFGLLFDQQKMMCKKPLEEQVVGFFVGESLYALFAYQKKMAFEFLTGTRDGKPKPIRLEEPFTFEKYHAQSNLEKYCIDPHITLDKLGIGVGTVPHGTFWRDGEIIVPLISSVAWQKEGKTLKSDWKIVDFATIAAEQIKNEIPHHLRINEYGVRIIDEYQALNIKAKPLDLDIPDDVDSESMAQIVADFSKELGINVAIGVVTSKLKQYYIKMVVEKVASRFAKKIVTHLIVRAVSVSVRLVLEVMDGMIVLLVIDLILGLSGLDLLKRSKAISQQSVDGVSDAAPHSLYKEYGVTMVEMSPILIISFLEYLHRDELQIGPLDEIDFYLNLDQVPKTSKIFSPPFDKAGIQVVDVKAKSDPGEAVKFLWNALSTLTVNSDGKLIDWKELSSLTSEEVDRFNAELDAAQSNLPQSFVSNKDYEKDFISNIVQPVTVALSFATILGIVCALWVKVRWFIILILAFSVNIFHIFLNGSLTGF